MNEELEMLEINDSELENVLYGLRGFGYPVVTVGKDVLYFNREFMKHIKEATHIRYYTTPEYVIIEPLSSGNYANSFKIVRPSGGLFGYTTLPVHLEEKKLSGGYRKIYKCKKGFAFKRYEVIEEDAA